MAPNYIHPLRLSKSHFESRKKINPKSMTHFSAFFKARPKNHVHHASHHDLTINSPQQNQAFSREPPQKLKQNRNKTP
jgi:hypothetical protein